MDLIRIYKCLCDETRLRILNLLSHSPLCVCHLQSILGKSQVVMSQHLGYLRKNGLVETRRHQTWIIYSIPAKPSAELQSNLKCLQDCVHSMPSFKKDLTKLKKIKLLGCELSPTRPESQPTSKSRSKSCC